MTSLSDPIAAFAYRAQTSAGEALSGTIDAASVDEASRRLELLRLRVLQLDPVIQAPVRPKALRGDDFLAFNTQLAHLTAAGLPVEQGLRLIAGDMRSRRLGETVRQIAAELESGRPLSEAFAKHADRFPPLYGQLINAGVRGGNLPGMLLNLGRHLELITRLRGALWQAASYPIMVLFSLALVLGFLCVFVFPKFEVIFRDFGIMLPAITVLVLNISRFFLDWWPLFLGLLLLLLVGPPLLWPIVRRLRWDQAILEALVFPLPLIGPALRRNTLARWCDALKLGVEVGLDLPAAITLAAGAVGSPRLQRDAARLVATIQSGRPLDENVHAGLIPPSVLTLLALSAAGNDLPAGLATLSQMFQQQAELKMAVIPAILTPLLVMLVGGMIAVVVLALFAPMISLIQAVSGPGN